ncbi:Wzz/FepE/Etk N-terminal domain-containing protein [Kitasatospora sp. SUK 42]|uniref:Wzz/FepE/Etk N-terminal domain-containing protein n=1 Tax=Kitasatospora sp. SUK 42 TaxID=1588882 RepID=UPI0018C95E7C|nr:Wzz/FepE/Etk N-terminal domain-containing protein [Kitasatospora sp. SUK 42]MBV2151360.1 hypothetical protein [Kitasatospora sp. SUK 42]
MTTPRRSARRLVRRWWPVALAVPLGAAAGGGYAVVSHPSYTATAYVLVAPQNPGESMTATNFAQAYGRLAGQPQVLAVAAAETGHTRAELATLVHGTTSPDAPMIEISGTGRRPRDAARTADAVAESLVAFANTSSKDTNVRLVTLAPAAAPDKPTTPSGRLDVAVGAAAGVLLGSLVMMTRRRGPAAAEPAVAEAATGPSAEADAVEPVAVEPVAAESAAVEPDAVEPVAAESAAVEPDAVEPVAVEPVAAEPGAVEAPSAPEPPEAETPAPTPPRQRTEEQPVEPKEPQEPRAGAETEPGTEPESSQEPSAKAKKKADAGSER